MAKRKAARAKGRKTAGKRAGASRARSRAAGSAWKKRAAQTSARLRKASARQASRKGAARKDAARKGAAKKGVAKKVARKATRKATSLRKASARQAVRQSPARGVRVGKPGGRPEAALTSARKMPALNRERRVVRDDDLLPSPPSSLDLDRSASSARSGRRELVEKLHQHTEASPALTGGDNPTPDQDTVDDIGKALGLQYEDNEELKGEKKISDRDKKRWKLDPTSSDDYDER